MTHHDFPLLQGTINGKKIVYLDSAATTQKPQIVLKGITDFYTTANANVHRGLHTLSARATAQYEAARQKIARFIGANDKEVIFVRNTTEGINLVAHAFAKSRLKKGDIIVSTVMEHHSNIVPWQLIAQETGANLCFIPITEEGLLDMQMAMELLEKKPVLLAITHVSNVLGTINPAKELIRLAHAHGTFVLVDAAQSVPHLPVNVHDLDCDFLAFSGHKMLGPTGIGVLFGKQTLLDRMHPFLGGGDMIKEVHLDKSTWNELPWKFEAGTPDIAGAIGLGIAVDYLMTKGMDNVFRHEQELLAYALQKMKGVKDVIIYGPGDATKRSGVISFNLADIHPHDLTTVMDEEGVMIRSGHHCAQPLMGALGVTATARISISVYTTKEDIDTFITALEKAQKVFRL
ncbi:cysteine desulfurase [Candidatus Woesearchaeota archaeon]|nr:cysteine desulfurase [Candidatus Woesearchaeota archaeon]